jgi:hypothetical protein
LNANEAAKYKLQGDALTSSKLATAGTREGERGYELAPGSYNFAVKQ